MMAVRTVRMDLMRDLGVRRISAVTMAVNTNVTAPLMDPDVCVPLVSIWART